MSDTRTYLTKMIQFAVGGCADYWAGLIADCLLAHGVTVQEWIPAKEPPKESGEYIVMIHRATNPTMLLYHAEEKSWFEVTMEDGEEVYTYYPVDCWMPLPEAPKEIASERANL